MLSWDKVLLCIEWLRASKVKRIQLKRSSLPFTCPSEIDRGEVVLEVLLKPKGSDVCLCTVIV